MKKAFFLLLILLVYLVSAPQQIQAQVSKIVIDHTNVNADTIPQSWLDQARQLDLFFTHKSVGNNIITGLTDLQSQNPGRYSLSINTGNSSWFTSNNGLIHLQPGLNGNPQSKIDGFNNLVRNDGYNIADAAMMKFCPGDPITGSVNFDQVWNNYKTMMEALEEDYPNTTFVWWTFPLASVSDARANQGRSVFNQALRDYCNTNGCVLFDIAAIQSHDPTTGNLLTDRNGYEAMYNGYTDDGGHLNEVGQQRVAKAWWWMMARVAGWNPGGVNPSPTPSPSASASPGVSPSPTTSSSPTALPTPACIPGDADNNKTVNIADLRFILNYYNDSFVGTCTDQNHDSKLNSLDIAEVIVRNPHTNQYPSPTNSPAPLSGLKWGAFYAPHSAMIDSRYGMTGLITGQLTTKQAVMEALRIAEGHYQVIATIGSVSGCNGNIQRLDKASGNYNTTLASFKQNLNFTPAEVSELNRYIANGTLAAFRFFDEVHYLEQCGTNLSLSRCRLRRNNTTSTGYEVYTESSSLPVMPPNDFADFLFEIRQFLSSLGVSEKIVLGSTSASSYMLKVAERLEVLNGSEVLPTNSLLAYGGPGNDEGLKYGGFSAEVVKEYMDCQINKLPNSQVLYYLANKSSAYGPVDNTFWNDFIAMCQVANTDFMASWAWSHGNLANELDFETRLNTASSDILRQVRQSCQ